MKTGHLQFQCRNERVCKACEEPGHKEGDENCKYHKKHDAIVFKGKKDILSNFYECDIVWKDNNVNTSEKAYGVESAHENNRNDLANEIMRAQTGYDVKQLTKKIYKSPSWKEKKVSVMTDIVREKVRQVQEVKDTLLHSGDRIIVEAVPGDYFWSCGLDKESAAATDPDHYPGNNVLGQIFMKIRSELRDELQKDDGFQMVTPAKRKNSQDSAEIGSDALRKRENGTTPPTNS